MFLWFLQGQLFPIGEPLARFGQRYGGSKYRSVEQRSAVKLYFLSSVCGQYVVEEAIVLQERRLVPYDHIRVQPAPRIGIVQGYQHKDKPIGEMHHIAP